MLCFRSSSALPLFLSLLYQTYKMNRKHSVNVCKIWCLWVCTVRETHRLRHIQHIHAYTQIDTIHFIKHLTMFMNLNATNSPVTILNREIRCNWFVSRIIWSAQEATDWSHICAEHVPKFCHMSLIRCCSFSPVRFYPTDLGTDLVQSDYTKTVCAHVNEIY